MALRVFFGNVAIPICFHNMLGTTMRCHLIQVHGSCMLYAKKIENPIENHANPIWLALLTNIAKCPHVQ